MKFLLLAAFVAVASAEYHDDVFHFSVGGVASPVVSRKYSAFAPAYAKQYTTVESSPVYSSFVAQPAYAQQYSALKRVAAPVLVKSIEQEIPVYSHVAQPVYAQQYAVKKVVEPVYSRFAAVNPVYSQYSAVKDIAQPVYSQYSTLKKVAQPAFYGQQYAAVKKVVEPVYSQYSTLKKVAQPALFAQTQYAAKPLIAHQYSDLAGISTYASAYNGPQFRILSQVQEADPAGGYKTAYATENGIQASEEGVLVGGAEGAVVAAQGAFSYTSPEGQVVSVNYVADENGFRAAGDHLPTPPPIPAEIVRSLEINARSSEQYDEQGRLLLKK